MKRKIWTKKKNIKAFHDCIKKKAFHDTVCIFFLRLSKYEQIIYKSWVMGSLSHVSLMPLNLMSETFSFAFSSMAFIGLSSLAVSLAKDFTIGSSWSMAGGQGQSLRGTTKKNSKEKKWRIKKVWSRMEGEWRFWGYKKYLLVERLRSVGNGWCYGDVN